MTEKNLPSAGPSPSVVQFCRELQENMSARSRGAKPPAAATTPLSRKRARRADVLDVTGSGGGAAVVLDDGGGPDAGPVCSRPDTPSLFGRCLLAVAEADRQGTAPSALPPPLAVSPPADAAGSADAGHAAVGAPETSPRHALAIAFKLNTHPSAAEMAALGAFLKLETAAIAAWFERRRQLEVWARDMARELLGATANAATASAPAGCWPVVG